WANPTSGSRSCAGYSGARWRRCARGARPSNGAGLITATRCRCKPGEIRQSHEMKRLDGKVAIVFGAGPNIGGTIAHFFAREAARIAVADIDGQAAAGTAA